MGLQHALQDVETLRELPGRHRRPDDRLLAGPDQRRRHSHAVHARGRHRADDLRPARRRGAGRRQRASPSIRSRARASRRASTTPTQRQADAVLLDARHPRDLPRRVEGRIGDAGGPERLGRFRQPALGALQHRRGPERMPRPRRGEAGEAPGADRALVGRGRQVRRPAARVPRRHRHPTRAAAPALEATRPLHLLPGLRRGARVGHPEHPQPLLRDRRRAARSTRRKPAASCSRRDRASADTPST